MPKGEKTSATAEVIVPEHIQQELTLLRGFRDLMAERVGYALGVQAINEDMREKTEEQRKASNEARKHLRMNLETFIQNGDFEGYKNALAQIEKTGKELKEARKPFVEKINPLRKGIKYIDNIAVPDSLKQLGATVQPAFSLSEWIQKVLEERKKAARKKK